MREIGFDHVSTGVTMPSSRNKSFPGIVQRSRPAAEVARSYGLALADRGQLGREMAQGASRTRDGESVERGERRRPRRLKAELREARMEAEPLEESGGPRPPREPPVSIEYGFIRSGEGHRPCPAPCAGGVEASQVRLLRLPVAGPVRQQPGEDRSPAVITAGFFAESEQILRPPPHPGRARPATEPRPARWSVPVVMAANGMTPCQPQEEGPNHHPGRGPPRPAGAGPRRNHAADAPAVTWAGDITLHPGPGKGGSPHLATVTGLHPARRSSAAPVAGHTPYRADQRGPDPWPPGSARRSGAPRCLRSDRLNLPSTPLPGTRK